MKKFEIGLSELQEGYITVEARDEKEAEKKAFQLIANNGFDLLDSEIFKRIVNRKVERL
jgi:hypothetical protein